MLIGYILHAKGETSMRFSILVIVALLISGSAMAQKSDIASALAVCQKDPEPKARIACYEAVKEIQGRKENPFAEVLKNLEKSVSKGKNNAPKPKPKENAKDKFARSAISVNLFGKNFLKSDYRAGRYEDFLKLQLEFKAKGIKKPTRAIKGIIVFSDLFGEVKVRLRWTLDDPMAPGQMVNKFNSGFEPNQFSDSHRWLRTTKVEDISTKFEVKNIIYADGSKWNMSK
jgi:hypothetical protein